MFRDIRDSIKSTYNSDEDDISSGFYNLLLDESVSYKRVSGYFSANLIMQYAKGMENFAKNNGIARFIISVNISQQDFEKIKQGYYMRRIKDKLSETDKKRLGNLAYMIATGHVDIKFGLVSNGIFHSKWGLFEDKKGDNVYFNGSNNETLNAVNNNYEDFDVDVSWDTSENVKKRILDKKKKFDKLWENKEPNIEIREASKMVYEAIKEFNNGKIQNIVDDEKVILDVFKDGYVLKDHTRNHILKENFVRRKVEVLIDKKRGYPYLSGKNSYVTIERKMDRLKKVLKMRHVSFSESDAVKNKFQIEKYSISEFKKSGLTIKDDDSRWDKEFKNFSGIVNKETTRKLVDIQMKSAFYMYIQKRAANFSVPGSGKTAMLLGTFAYLNRDKSRKINRILVISPINAFNSWREEFKEVFKDKKELNSLSAHDNGMNPLRLRAEWSKKNLVLINYESLHKYCDALIEALKADNGTTMLVFDEVHRIKGLDSKRASDAKKIVEYTRYRYVLTGTPIPNGYQDIWNFLHLLYKNEYNSFFNLSISTLKKPSEFLKADINNKLQPFFWRTNKDDLGVPPANPDNLEEVSASIQQNRLADLIFAREKNQLSVLVRLLQLSTNPKLLSKSISYADLGFSDIDIPGKDSYDQVSSEVANKIKNEIRKSQAKNYRDINLNEVSSPKFDKGIELVKKLVSKHKRVIVWGIFVDTLEKITDSLRNNGINTELIYGGTPIDERANILSEFKKESSSIQVLVSNPNTLGESVSLHKYVHDAVYFEYNYNLTFMLQSRDRIHRLGLKKTDETNYYYLMTVSDKENCNFIDKKVYDRLNEKEKRMKDIIDSNILEPEFSDDVFEEMKTIIDEERP
ncbi:SNF2-related protein [Companilactobacillus farciminis]|uniref:SNF2-related protein n=1 Tax=Companilactobacillus farciminis TaxID=1612 RepID=UPI00241E0C2F|nr:SNF2-related protein [Companilactobacillus farciminis]